MNGIIDVLEALSGPILPWVFLGGALAAMTAFSFLAWQSASNRNHLSRSNDMFTSRSSSKSDATRAMSDLQMTWAARRNYVDTLRIGPIMHGVFAGWFAEERELCESFATAKKKLADEQKLREKEHPEIQQRYLAIVNESERKPHSFLIYAGLFFLMAVEAIGFSLIFADRLSDTASAQAVQQYAIGISIVIAVFALFFADRIGRAVYRQGYAHAAHLHSPNNSLQRTTNRALGIEDEELDAHAPQSMRIVNRSDYVNAAAAEARMRNRLTKKYPLKLWTYIAAVFAFGAIIFFVRLGQIDEYYAKEAQREAAVTASEAPAKSGTAIPPGVAQSKAEAGEVLTQEALEKEKRGKQLAIGVFVAIFFIAQTLGVVLAAARGFASNMGEEAFAAIRRFRALHGDISLEQWKLALQAETDSADRYAQESLSGWQLGLQTAFTNKAMPVPNEAYFAQCAGDFSHRTYSAFLQLQEHAALSTTKTIAAMPHFVPPAAPPAAAPAPAPLSSPAPAISSSVKESVAHVVAIGPAQVAESSVEYFISSASGTETVERCTLAELQTKILRGQIANLGALNVRAAGQPGRFLPWSEFVEKETV